MELLSKISIKNVVGNAKSLAPKKAEDAPIQVVRVLGQASGVKTGESNFGPWVAFTGSFQAIKIETGEIFRSSKIFLPEIATSLLLPVVEQAENGSVDFAFDIGIKFSENAIGYEYTVTPLLDTAESDPVSAIAGKLPALPSPKQGNLALPDGEVKENGDKKATKK